MLLTIARMPLMWLFDCSEMFEFTYIAPHCVVFCVLNFTQYLLSECAQCRLYHSCGAQHNPPDRLLRQMKVQLGKHLPVRNEIEGAA